MTVDSSANADWIVGQFSKARVEGDPCPHLIVENVLPRPLYDAIERDIPGNLDWRLAGAVQLLAARWREARTAPPRRRAEILKTLPRDLSAGHFPQVGIDLAGVKRTPFLRRHSRRWSEKYLQYVRLMSALTERAFAANAADYMHYLIEAGLYQEPQPQTAAFQEFCLRTQGWAIRPHVHDLRQAIQWMLYFPLPGSTEDQGTAFFRVTKKKKISAASLSGTIWFEPDEVEHGFTAPYRANTLIAFLNTPLSAHGSIAIPHMVARRYLFVGSYWKAKPEALDIEIAPPVRAPNDKAIV